MHDNAHILLFRVEKNKIKQIETLCRSLHIRITIVKSDSYLQTLGYLARITGFKRSSAVYTGPEFPSEMMIFSGMDSERLDEFLAAYIDAAIPPIGLKAIITPNNIHWNASMLYKELFKEHQQFQHGKSQ